MLVLTRRIREAVVARVPVGDGGEVRVAGAGVAMLKVLIFIILALLVAVLFVPSWFEATLGFLSM